jgi:hypothetical protein
MLSTVCWTKCSVEVMLGEKKLVWRYVCVPSDGNLSSEDSHKGIQIWVD